MKSCLNIFIFVFFLTCSSTAQKIRPMLSYSGFQSHNVFLGATKTFYTKQSDYLTGILTEAYFKQQLNKDRFSGVGFNSRVSVIDGLYIGGSINYLTNFKSDYIIAYPELSIGEDHGFTIGYYYLMHSTTDKISSLSTHNFRLTLIYYSDLFRKKK
jgi:hypothetical protein